MIISICWISDDHFYHVSIFFASSLLISAAFSKGFPLCQDPKAATVVVARSFLPMLPGGGPFQSPLYRLKPWGVKSPWKNFTISSLNTVPWSLGRCFFFLDTRAKQRHHWRTLGIQATKIHQDMLLPGTKKFFRNTYELRWGWIEFVMCVAHETSAG